jgi:hypothetical protein
MRVRVIALNSQAHAGGEAYIVSQRHAGWVALANMYDDGGLSGGTMGQAQLQQADQLGHAGGTGCDSTRSRISSRQREQKVSLFLAGLPLWVSAILFTTSSKSSRNDTAAVQAGAAMQEAAKGFRRLKAFKQLPLLQAALAVRKARATSSNAHLAHTTKAA